MWWSLNYLSKRIKEIIDLEKVTKTLLVMMEKWKYQSCLFFILCFWVKISQKSAEQVREIVSTQWNCLFMYLISRQFRQRIYIHTLMRILCQSIEWSEIGWEVQDIFHFCFFVLKFSVLESFSVFTLLNCLSINVTSLKIELFTN